MGLLVLYMLVPIRRSTFRHPLKCCVLGVSMTCGSTYAFKSSGSYAYCFDSARNDFTTTCNPASWYSIQIFKSYDLNPDCVIVMQYWYQSNMLDDDTL